MVNCTAPGSLDTSAALRRAVRVLDARRARWRRRRLVLLGPFDPHPRHGLDQRADGWAVVLFPDEERIRRELAVVSRKRLAELLQHLLEIFRLDLPSREHLSELSLL